MARSAWRSACITNVGDAGDRDAAGAGQRAGAHRGGFHHRRLGGFAHLSPQYRLAIGARAWLGRRARRGSRRLGAFECRCRVRRPFVYGYLLLMGGYILFKAARIAPIARAPAGWIAPVGFGAGFLDASGGGGWGRSLTSTLVGSGHAPRQTVGSVNATEFVVTMAAATTFFVELGASPLQHLVPLVIGGVIAAPFGGWAVKRVSARAVDDGGRMLIVALSLFQLGRAVQADLGTRSRVTAPSRSACRPAAAPTSGSALARRSASAPPASS